MQCRKMFGLLNIPVNSVSACNISEFWSDATHKLMYGRKFCPGCSLRQFGANMIRMSVGFYGLGLISDLMRTWNAWYSLSMQAARLAWDAQAVVALRFMQIA